MAKQWTEVHYKLSKANYILNEFRLKDSQQLKNKHATVVTQAKAAQVKATKTSIVQTKLKF